MIRDIDTHLVRQVRKGYTNPSVSRCSASLTLKLPTTRSHWSLKLGEHTKQRQLLTKKSEWVPGCLFFYVQFSRVASRSTVAIFRRDAGVMVTSHNKQGVCHYQITICFPTAQRDQSQVQESVLIRFMFQSQYSFSCPSLYLI